MNIFASFHRLVLAASLLTAIPSQAQPLLITTVAGYAGKGASDGIGAGALFTNPQGVAVDNSGNIYVADTGNHTIRLVTPAGVSSTIAGLAGVSGSVDATGVNARFNQPAGIALDAATNLYVSDYGNHTIRKVTLAGQVTTLVGTAGFAGSVNATGTNAFFFHPLGIAVDSATNLYIADYGNQLIRKITPAKVVSTLAGSAGVAGFTNATGTNAVFNEPEGVAVDVSGNVYVADTGNAVIRKITSVGVTTTFGGAAGQFGSVDSHGVTGLLYQPVGITINSAGTVFVSDAFNNTIRQVTSSGIVITLAGLAGTTGSTDGVSNSARFCSPQGVAVNASGTIYIADTGNSSIRLLSSGVVSTLAGSPSIGSANGLTPNARFYNPRNVVVDNASNIFVADTQNSVIRKITPLGVVSIFAGSVGVFGSTDGNSALFSGPQGLALDSANNLYVADTGNSTIRKISSGGFVSTVAGIAGVPGNADGLNAQFFQPQGIAVDGGNNLYVADTGNHVIRKIVSNGTVSTLAGLANTFGSFDGLNGNARFNAPTGITVDGSGNLYVTDFNNNTIRKVTTAGAVTTLAGWAGIWGSVDGTNGSALFSGPAGISVDHSGNLYVVDSGNYTLRKVTPAGVVTTIAGSADVSGSVDGTTALFSAAQGVAIDNSGYLYVADSGNNTIRSQGIPPVIVIQPQSQTNLAGNTVVFTVTAYGSSPFTYTWQYNSTNFAPSGSSSLVASNAGNYLVTVSNIAGFALSSVATLTLTNPAVPPQPGVFQTITAHAGNVQLGLAGTTNATYTLLVSTNLLTWSNLSTFSMTNGAVLYQDLSASNVPTRFYRLVSP